ncbi:YdcF family protein [uncultured Lamprocystis sp.]|uniref:YdcF family protein n=1 Tax=uncultured Lamprocystis sp. TaxID=543132 RepID=UPI00345AADE1
MDVIQGLGGVTLLWVLGLSGVAAGGLAFPGSIFGIPLAVIVIAAWRVRRAERCAVRWIPHQWISGAPSGSRPALLVFGAKTTPNGPSAELRARLDHAWELWRRGAAPLILVSGGVDKALDEVESMTAYLLELGVPEDAVKPCRPGGSTRQTISAVRRIVGGGHLSPIIAVSSAFHACRIQDEARRQGVTINVSAPAETPETCHRRTYRVRFFSEILAVLWYALPHSWANRIHTGTDSWRHRLPLVLAGQLPLRHLFAQSTSTKNNVRHE